MNPVRVVNTDYLVIRVNNDGTMTEYPTTALGAIRLLAAEMGSGFSPVFPAMVIPLSVPTAFVDDVREAAWRHRPQCVQ